MKKALMLTLLIALMPALASAQIRQVSSSRSDAQNTVNFTIGYFALHGLDSRDPDDTLLADLQNAEPLLFEIKDFNGAPFGGEYLFGIGSHFEAGVGLSYYQRTVHSVYANLTHANGSEIDQDLKLRTVPVAFTGRFLLLPRGSAIEPYIGGGLVAIRWKYSEIGEFVDIDRTIFPGTFIEEGTSSGPIILGGARFPVGPVVAGGEVGWQKVVGDFSANTDMLGTKIDLGGWTTNFTIGVRF
jgi:hypothetical protein